MFSGQIRTYYSDNDLIMIVDDDSLVRKAVTDILNLSGFKTIEAENGCEALDMHDESRPVLILMDVMMPIMGGYEACRLLRQRVPDLSLPIIMLTSLDDIDVIDKALQSGATDYITKPFNPRLLVIRICYALRDRAMYIDLKEQKRRLADTQRIAKIGYGQINLSQGIISLSEEIAGILGMPDAQTVSLNEFSQMLTESDQVDMFETIDKVRESGGAYSFEHKLVTANNEDKLVVQRGEVSRESNETIVMVTLQDVTEQAHAEERVRFHTYYDFLTSLPNRRLFEKNLKEQLLAEQPLAVMFIGLDRFKSVNDAFGHGYGDELLKKIAERLSTMQDFGIKLSRFSGDLFVLTVSNYLSIEVVNELAEEVLARISEPMLLNGLELRVTASLGIAIFPEEANISDKLILGADMAMNHAKNEGGAQYRYFTNVMDAQAQERLALEHDLHHAIQKHQFEVYYQPQVEAASGRVVGMEALLRWNHPQRGLILPARFIPLAEEIDMISEIGDWVLRTACMQAQQWASAGYGNLRVGVNLSVKQLNQADLGSDIRKILNVSHLKPELLDIEITESMAVSDFDNTSRTLKDIRSLGVKTSMDDFGTGYSSLSYLQKLPLDTLKIDRAFIKDINKKGENGEIAKAIIAMAHSIGLHVIAEGIETKYQYQYLLEHACDEIQGFYVSRPLPSSAVESFLDRSKKVEYGLGRG